MSSRCSAPNAPARSCAESQRFSGEAFGARACAGVRWSGALPELIGAYQYCRTPRSAALARTETARPAKTPWIGSLNTPPAFARSSCVGHKRS